MSGFGAARTSPTDSAALARIAADWRAEFHAVEAADRRAAENGFAALYRASGWRPPSGVLWFDSPAAAAPVVVAQREPALFPPGPDHFGAAAVRAAYPAGAWLEIERHFSRRSRDSVKRILDEPLRERAGRTTPALARPGCGQHDASWVGAFDAGSRIFGVEQPRGVDGWATLARSCGWWWAFRDTAIVCERQTGIQLDVQARLHATGGPALAFRDGFTIYAIHGVRVESWMVDEPERVTAQIITEQSNSEVRRVLMERYGIERYLDDIGAAATAQDRFGTLYHLTNGGREPIVLVKVRNSTPEPDGTWKDYFLRVPPDVRSAREAVAWTFGLDWSSYDPAVET